MPNDILKVKGIGKSYGNKEILKNISFDVKDGEKVVIIGPSGAGKSTLLRCINLLLRPDKGSIWLDQLDVTSKDVNEDKVRQSIGMVFQELMLFNHLSAFENVNIALTKVLKISSDHAYTISMEQLKYVGLDKYANHYPSQLSVGQKQRVAIARTLAMKPRLILFDEPTSALDPELIGGILEIMKRLASEGTTMICVTHEMRFAQEIADRIIFMDEGLIVEEAPPSLLFQTPKMKRTEEFLSGWLNNLE